MDNRPIGVFDSGLGGLTCVKALTKLLPEERVVYFGDTGRVPYGTKGPETIRRFACQDIGFLLERDVKLIVAACGTVSSTLTEARAGALPVPYMTVIRPAAAAAVAASKRGRIGVLGTAATIRSGSYGEALRALRPGAEVFGEACPMLVPLVEYGYAAHPAARMFVREYVERMLENDVDALILGCTHYPLLGALIAEVAGGVPLIDPGAETARAAREWIAARGMEAKGQGGVEFYVSDLPESFAETAELFLREPVRGRVEVVNIESVRPVALG